MAVDDAGGGAGFAAGAFAALLVKRVVHAISRAVMEP
jgi:hypothetical protein